MSEEAGPWIRFQDELPSCCGGERLRLPRPSFAIVEVRGEFGRDEYWMLGLDQWHMRVGVTWAGEEDALAEAVSTHVGSTDDVEPELAAHGVHFDENGDAWVGEQVFVVARNSPPNSLRQTATTQRRFTRLRRRHTDPVYRGLALRCAAAHHAGLHVRRRHADENYPSCGLPCTGCEWRLARPSTL